MFLAEHPDMDVEDYLLLDTTSKTAKYEYLDGMLYMLAGGSNNHSIIAANITAILNYALRKTPCIVYSSDVRVKLSESRYVHPDVTISCDERDRQASNNVQYPRVIFEVLSPSTEVKDKGEKLLAYLDCSSLEEYILVDSRTVFVEVYHKDKNKWTSTITRSDDPILLQSISLEISLEDIYAKTSIK